MLEFIGAIVLAIVLWTLRSAFYKQSEVWKDKVGITVAEANLDLQDDISDLHKRISDKKASQDGKWNTLHDVEELMR